MDEIVRRVPTFTEYDKQGRDDQQMADSAAAIAEEEIEVPYTPPLPVPIASPVVRGPNERGKRSSVWLAQPVTTVTSTVGAMANLVGGGVADGVEDFPINSIMVDNFTVLWAYWPEMGKWVPPFTFGVTFRAPGTNRKRVRWEYPPAVAAAGGASAAQSSQVARVTFYEELLPEQAGQVVPAADR